VRQHPSPDTALKSLCNETKRKQHTELKEKDHEAVYGWL
jgi:hypothetical protein